ncbi:hypothetical protein B0T10DRAFT_28046 [Thelonectria olida]|uniref:Uncharacterized protein n=1 Tax=Thelonectria olida TaxID=1576542 RepID=A0A9P8WJ41_9HYPO|nr:hypothetical protein B0T10DRAFT_28046 [Thelonectria olida]
MALEKKSEERRERERKSNTQPIFSELWWCVVFASIDESQSTKVKKRKCYPRKAMGVTDQMPMAAKRLMNGYCKIHTLPCHAPRGEKDWSEKISEPALARVATRREKRDRDPSLVKPSSRSGCCSMYKGSNPVAAAARDSKRMYDMWFFFASSASFFAFIIFSNSLHCPPLSVLSKAEHEAELSHLMYGQTGARRGGRLVAYLYLFFCINRDPRGILYQS